MKAIERHRQTWQGKSDEWLFERLDNELKQKVEEIHRLLSKNEVLRQPPVMPSVSIEKLKQIRRIADAVYHDLVSSNHPTHDEWCSSPKNLKVIMSIVDKLLGNEA